MMFPPLICAVLCGVKGYQKSGLLTIGRLRVARAENREAKTALNRFAVGERLAATALS
jgi:hypothetical protein